MPSITHFDSIFSIIFGIVGILFVVVIVTFIVFGIKALKRWNKNNNSPKLTVDAQVVTKREDVSHQHHHNSGTNNMHTSSSTYYFVTFQVESGDRMELNVGGDQFGMLAEGDSGSLSFQGTRYLEFERKQ